MSEREKQLEDALQGALAWLRLICDSQDIEPEETFVNANAINRETGDRRTLAKVSLAQGLAKFEAALGKPSFLSNPPAGEGR